MHSKRIEEIRYPEYTIEVRDADSDGYMKDVQLDFVELRLG